MKQWNFLVSTGLLLLFLGAPALAYAQQMRAGKLALVGGRLLDGTEGPPLQNAVVLVEGNRIVAEGRSGRSVWTLFLSRQLPPQQRRTILLPCSAQLGAYYDA